MTTPAPGWYPDPQVPLQMRWWDGQQWSDDTYQRVAPLDDWTTTPVGPAGPAVGAVRPTTQATSPGPATPDGVPLAGWGRRAVARMMDGLLTWSVTCVIGYRPLAVVVETVVDQSREAVRAARRGARTAYVEDPAMLRALAVLSLLWLGVTLAYDLVFLPRWGATPGKRLLGLRVRRWEDDRALTSSRVGVRWLTSSVLSSVGVGGLGLVYGLVDAVRPLWHPRRQSLHDRFADTCVVRGARGADR